MAELTFNSPIRRDKWPRWMIKLHEYLTRIYDRPIPEVDYDDYDRLKRIIFEKIVILRKGMILNRTSIFVYIVKGDSGYGVVILRNNKVAITYNEQSHKNHSVHRIFHHHRAADYFGIHPETCRKNARYTWLAVLDGTTHGEERMG